MNVDIIKTLFDKVSMSNVLSMGQQTIVVRKYSMSINDPSVSVVMVSVNDLNNVISLIVPGQMAYLIIIILSIIGLITDIPQHLINMQGPTVSVVLSGMSINHLSINHLHVFMIIQHYL